MKRHADSMNDSNAHLALSLVLLYSLPAPPSAPPGDEGAPGALAPAPGSVEARQPDTVHAFAHMRRLTWCLRAS